MIQKVLKCVLLALIIVYKCIKRFLITVKSVDKNNCLQDENPQIFVTYLVTQ